MNVSFVVVQEVRIWSVPPFVISMRLPADADDIAVTFRVFVPPAGHWSVPAEAFPTTRLPYARLAAALSNVQTPLILRLSPAAGRVPPQLAAELKFPGPVKVLVAQVA